MPDDYELPELAAEHDADPDPLGPWRHSYEPRHRMRVDIGLDAKGNVVRRDTVGHFVRDLVVIAVVAVVISVVVKTFFLRPFYIPSASMQPTLLEGDRVLVNLLVPAPMELQRGDVIVFQDPGGWLPTQASPPKPVLRAVLDGVLETVGLKPEDTDNHLIKRVIGLPGDHVVCCNAYGQLVINDVAIHEPFTIVPDNQPASGMEFDVTVPADSVWVMGDHRYNSEDSRYHQDLPAGGFVPYDDIVGRAFLINWPFDRLQFLGNHPASFAAVPKRDAP